MAIEEKDQKQDHEKRIAEMFKNSERQNISMAVQDYKLAMQKILLEWQREGLNPCEDYMNFNNAVDLDYQIRRA